MPNLYEVKDLVLDGDSIPDTLGWRQYSRHTWMATVFQTHLDGDSIPDTLGWVKFWHL